MAANPEIGGHPTLELIIGGDTEPTMITVCASCGQMRTILFLSRDRWLCTKCRVEGATSPHLYPVA